MSQATGVCCFSQILQYIKTAVVDLYERKKGEYIWGVIYSAVSGRLQQDTNIWGMYSKNIQSDQFTRKLFFVRSGPRCTQFCLVGAILAFLQLPQQNYLTLKIKFYYILIIPHFSIYAYSLHMYTHHEAKGHRVGEIKAPPKLSQNSTTWAINSIPHYSLS